MRPLQYVKTHSRANIKILGCNIHLKPNEGNYSNSSLIFWHYRIVPPAVGRLAGPLPSNCRYSDRHIYLRMVFVVYLILCDTWLYGKKYLLKNGIRGAFDFVWYVWQMKHTNLRMVFVVYLILLYMWQKKHIYLIMVFMLYLVWSEICGKKRIYLKMVIMLYLILLDTYVAK